MSKIGQTVYNIFESEAYLESFLGLAAQVQDGESLEMIAQSLEVVQEMVRSRRMTKKEYLKAMCIIPKSNETPTLKAA